MANRKAIDPADCTRYDVDDEYERYQRALRQGEEATPEYWSQLCDGTAIHTDDSTYRDSYHKENWSVSGTINS